jgi:hypothetical protein
MHETAVMIESRFIGCASIRNSFGCNPWPFCSVGSRLSCEWSPQPHYGPASPTVYRRVSSAGASPARGAGRANST